MLCDQVSLDIVTRRLDTERADVFDLRHTMARLVLNYRSSHREFNNETQVFVKGATVVAATSALLCVTGINDAEADR
jgi:hypothetical protein